MVGHFASDDLTLIFCSPIGFPIESYPVNSVWPIAYIEGRSLLYKNIVFLSLNDDYV